MASENVSRKMVLESKYVNANNAVIHTENSKLLLDLNCNWDFGKNQPGNWDLVPPFTTVFQIPFTRLARR